MAGQMKNLRSRGWVYESGRETLTIKFKFTNKERQGSTSINTQHKRDSVQITKVGSVEKKRKNKCRMGSLPGRLAVTPQTPESTVGQPMAVRLQGIYVEYSVEYSKCRALNGI
eukprot:1186474-Prorocentrum_minimum.AAC.6